MKSALRRALSIADEIESFNWTGSPGDDPDGIYASIHYLRSVAIKLKAAAQDLGHPHLHEVLEKLQINIDGNDFGAGVALHAELLGIAGWLHDAIVEWGDDPACWQSTAVGIVDRSPAKLDEKPLHTKEKESLLKLVIGMAIKGYGYDPSAARSGVPGEIVTDLAEVGLEIDEGTVTKYLKWGRKLVPSNINEHDSP